VKTYFPANQEHNHNSKVVKTKTMW